MLVRNYHYHYRLAPGVMLSRGGVTSIRIILKTRILARCGQPCHQLALRILLPKRVEAKQTASIHMMFGLVCGLVTK